MVIMNLIIGIILYHVIPLCIPSTGNKVDLKVLYVHYMYALCVLLVLIINFYNKLLILLHNYYIYARCHVFSLSTTVWAMHVCRHGCSITHIDLQPRTYIAIHTQLPNSTFTCGIPHDVNKKNYR